MTTTDGIYCIPKKFRVVENLHIVFWLFKDLSWVMLWRPLGIFMILPTMSAALLITWQTRHIKAELFHNLAVIFWICANAYWMIIEFRDMPDSYRYYAAIPFSIGIFFIAYYYLIVLPAERRKEKILAASLSIPKTNFQHNLPQAEG